MPGDYYSEWDPFAAAWLRELIKAGEIPDGEVDTRSILDVRAADLRGFRHCHFFAGIGGWARAFRLGGIEDGRQRWSGSCPCQPLSSAGKQQGHADERHLWPAFHDLIDECKPAGVFGEQVTNPLGREWIAGVRLDLEAAGYAVGIANLPACSVGAPHIRYRNFWVAYAQGADRRSEFEAGRSRRWRGGSAGGSASGRLADATDRQLPFAERGSQGRYGARPAGPLDPDSSLSHPDGGQPGHRDLQPGGQHGQQPQDGIALDGLGDTEGMGLAERERNAGDAGEDSGAPARQGFEQAGGGRVGMGDAQGGGRGILGDAPLAWGGRHSHGPSIAIRCADGKWRRVPANEAGEPEPILFPLATGIPNRVGSLRGSGNAIHPVVAARFIQAAEGAVR